MKTFTLPVQTDPKYLPRDWEFCKKPALPLKEAGYFMFPGWDIPICWAKDAADQWWRDDGHGSWLKPCAFTELPKGLVESFEDRKKKPGAKKRGLKGGLAGKRIR